MMEALFALSGIAMLGWLLWAAGSFGSPAALTGENLGGCDYAAGGHA